MAMQVALCTRLLDWCDVDASGMFKTFDCRPKGLDLNTAFISVSNLDWITKWRSSSINLRSSDSWRKPILRDWRDETTAIQWYTTHLTTACVQAVQVPRFSLLPITVCHVHWLDCAVIRVKTMSVFEARRSSTVCSEVTSNEILSPVIYCTQ